MIYKSGIYKITNIITNQAYYGSSCNLISRLSKHKKDLEHNKHNNRFLQNSYNKYGSNNFIYSILFYCDKGTLLLYEQRLLDKYWDNQKTCFNMAKQAGSCLGVKHTKRTCDNLSARMKGHKVSEETRVKLAAASKGNKNCLGKKHSVETIAKMSKPRSEQAKINISTGHIGHSISEETRLKLSSWERTEETRAKIAEGAKGNKNWLGKKHSEESKLKMSITKQQKKLEKL